MKPSRLKLVLAFLCIYVVWGSTYLAIRISVETIPPFLMGGTRFLVAGALLYGVSRARGAPRPDIGHWKNSLIIGALLLLIGNGAVAWAEQRVSSGMTALLVATMPVWLVLIEAWQGRRPALLQWIGVGIGLLGVGLLVIPGSDPSTTIVSPLGAIVLTIGSLSWTAGSLYSRKARLATPASVASGMQMLCGGTLMLLASAARGELTHLDIHAITSASLWGWLYLIGFGSIIGFSTYMWLLKNASPVAVGTYAYVNPVVAVLLGVMLGGEILPPSAVLAMVVIVIGVALVSLAPYLRHRTAIRQ